MMDEPTFWGWSDDGEYFVACHETPGEGCDACEFVAVDGTRERVSTAEVDHPNEPTYADSCSLAIRDRLDDRLRDQGFSKRPHPSPFEGEVVLDTSDRGSHEDGSWLRIHAQRRDGTGRVQLLELRTPGFGEVHIDAKLASPRGDRVAVIVHRFAGEFTDEITVHVLDAPTIIERVNGAVGAH